MKKVIKNNNNLRLKSDQNLKRSTYYIDPNINYFEEGGKTDEFFRSGQFGDVLSSAGTIINAGINNAKIGSDSNIKQSINTFAATPVERSSREALSNQWVNSVPLNTSHRASEFTPSGGERFSNTLGATISGASTGAKVGGVWGAIGGAAIGLGSSIAGILTGNKKAREQAKRLNKLATKANEERQKNYYASADFLDEQDMFNYLSNYKSMGGPLSNIFERGGYLGHTHGSIFNNDVIHINEGDTHENNPYGGVQSGVDDEGTPNLVEEGEVIYNDYVFSNRLYPTEEQLEQYGLPKQYNNWTFAKIANELSKESEERTNDPISLNGLRDSMSKLRSLQETIRAEQDSEDSNVFARGGSTDDEQEDKNTNDNSIKSRLQYSFKALQNAPIRDDFLTGGKGDGTGPMGPEKTKEYIESIYNKARQYAEKNSNATTGSPRWNEIYQDALEMFTKQEEEKAAQIERDRIRNEEIAKENQEKERRQAMAEQFLTDRGYKRKRQLTAKQTANGVGLFQAPLETIESFDLKNISEDDLQKYNEILRGLDTYGEQKPEAATGENTEGTVMDFSDDPNSNGSEAVKQNNPTGNLPEKKTVPGTQNQSRPANISTSAPKDLPELSFRAAYSNATNGMPDDKLTKPNNRLEAMAKAEYERALTRPQSGLDESSRPQYPQYEGIKPTDILDTTLRYAPALGNLLAYLGNSKDYSDVDAYMEQTSNPRSVAFTPLGNYIRPEYVSPWELTNPIEREAASTRRYLMNNAGNNRAAANAALVASDYNTLGLLGQALLQGKQYNQQQRLAAEEFNRGTDQFNSQGSLQAQGANMGLNNYYLNRALNNYNFRFGIDTMYDQARSQNITSLFNNLGNIGRENYIMNQINSNRGLYYNTDRSGRSSYKYV